MLEDFYIHIIENNSPKKFVKKFAGFLTVVPHKLKKRRLYEIARYNMSHRKITSVILYDSYIILYESYIPEYIVLPDL